MTKKSQKSRSDRQREIADYLFTVYQLMGAGRTLKRLSEIVLKVGGQKSEKTLERYSSKYDWQRRILEQNAVEKQRVEGDIQRAVELMNQRHAQISQGMMALVVASITKLQQDMKARQDTQQKLHPDQNIPQTLDITIPELTNLFRTAITGERLARGQATSRVDVWVDIASTVVREFGLIFISVNKMATEEEREEEFIRLSDEMMNRYYSETSRNQIDTTYLKGLTRA